MSRCPFYSLEWETFTTERIAPTQTSHTEQIASCGNQHIAPELAKGKRLQCGGDLEKCQVAQDVRGEIELVD